MHRLRFWLVAAFACVAAGLAAPQAVAATLFSVNLSAAEEVPPGTAPGSGTGSFALTTGASGARLAFDLLFSPDFIFDFAATDDLAVRGLHIHAAPRGVNGPVVYGMFGPNSNLDGEPFIAAAAGGFTRVTGGWDANEGNAGATLAAFIAATELLGFGEDAPFYLNLHTVAFPAGAIRGQLVAVPLPAGAALLIGGLLALGAIRRRA